MASVTFGRPAQMPRFGRGRSMSTSSAGGGAQQSAVPFPFLNPYGKSTPRVDPQTGLPMPNTKTDALGRPVQTTDSTGRDISGTVREGKGFSSPAAALNAGVQVDPWMPSRMGYQGGGHSTQMDGNTSGGAPKTAADYFRIHGGMSPQKPSLLNELYRNQPNVTMGAFDILQSQKAMDEADPMASFYQNKAGVASGAGDLGEADFWQSQLRDQLARRSASMPRYANGTTDSGPYPQTALVGEEGPEMVRLPPHSQVVPTPLFQMARDAYLPQVHLQQDGPYDGEQRFDQMGNLWQYDQRLGRGVLVMSAPPTFQELVQERMRRKPEEIGIRGGYRPGDHVGVIPEPTWVEGENLGEGTLYTPYGTASVRQGSVPASAPEGSTFTTPAPSSLSRPKTQSAADFFQEEANRSGENKYAVPAPGYQGVPHNAWSAYESAMLRKKALGKR